MTTPIEILKIPFIDFTSSIEGFAPTGVFALSTDFGQMLVGFVMPFPIIISEFISAMLSQFVLNPQILYRNEILHQWKAGLDVRGVGLFNGLDFWISYGMGKSFTYAIVGMAASIPMLIKFRQAQSQKTGQRGTLRPPPGRGDFPIWLMGLLWLFGMGHVRVAGALDGSEFPADVPSRFRVSVHPVKFLYHRPNIRDSGT